MSVPADSLGGMKVELSDMDPGSLEDMVGTDCYQAALGYVRRQAVVEQVWVAAQNTLWGLVQAVLGESYMPVIQFSRQGSVLEVTGVQCSCRASFGCEHAAALLIAATQAAEGTGGPDGQAVARQDRRPPSWDRSLESLLACGRDAGTPAETALAIELTLVADQAGRPPRFAAQPQPAGPSVRLMARLVQPGKNGGWIGGSLSWGKLDSYGYFTGCSGLQVQLLREMLALYRTRVSQPYYYYSHGDERSVELSAFESGRLWPLLDEAEKGRPAAGVRTKAWRDRAIPRR